MIIRQVLPGMFGHPARSTSAPPSHIPSLPISSSPAKPQGPVQGRIIKGVVPGPLQGFDHRIATFAAIQGRPVPPEDLVPEDTTNPAIEIDLYRKQEDGEVNMYY